MTGARPTSLLHLEKFWNCVLTESGIGSLTDEWLNIAVVWASPLCFIICCRMLIIRGGSFGEVNITKSQVVGETCVLINNHYCFVNQLINQSD